MEECVGRSPHLHTAHLCKMRFCTIESPFYERVEHDVGSHGTGEDHGSPLKIAVSRLVDIAQLYVAILRLQCHIERACYTTDGNDRIIESDGVAKEATHGVNHRF